MLFRSDSIHLERLDMNQKDMILKILPNGSPVRVSYNGSYISARERAFKKGADMLGYDFLIPVDTPIYATADGIVELANSDYYSGYGNYIKLNHSFGFSSVYAHLNKLEVKKGEFVKKGELIGYSGSSGNSSGERLYYEVRFLGAYLDPMKYIDWNLDSFYEIFSKEEVINWKELVWAMSDLVQLKEKSQSKGANSVAQKRVEDKKR